MTAGNRRTTWALGAGVTVALVTLGLLVGLDRGRGFDPSVVATARDLTSGLFLVAGVLRLIRWRFTGESYAARAALSLFAMGTALPGSDLLTALLHPGSVGVTTAPEVRVAFLVPAMAFLALANRPARRASDPLGVRMVAPVVLLAVAVVTAGHVVDSQRRYVDMQIMIEIVAAAVWAGLALRSWNSARGQGRPTLYLVASALGLMAASEAARAAVLHGATSLAGAGAMLQLLAAVVVTAASAIELRLTITSRGDDTMTLAHALLATQNRLAELEQTQRERLHDARSAVVGVLGASHLLGVDDGLPRTYEPDALHRMMVAELHRLQAVLEADAVEPAVTFRLADTLGPVLMAHRINGLDVTARLGGTLALGRPRATATAVDNLLRNALLHAPGAAVTVSAGTSAGSVWVVVDDTGPGIPAAERARVVLPGVRGTNAAEGGSGLGLFLAANSMRTQNGTLELAERPGGGTRVRLTLPAARVDPAPGAEHLTVLAG